MIHENQKIVERIEGIHFRSPKYQPLKDENVRVVRRGSAMSSKRNSLNFISRKAEEDRIHKENMKMFEKLKQSKSHLLKSDQDKDFEQHRRFQAKISRMNKLDQNMLMNTVPRPVATPKLSNFQST